jgi:hypothetical protein
MRHARVEREGPGSGLRAVKAGTGCMLAGPGNIAVVLVRIGTPRGENDSEACLGTSLEAVLFQHLETEPPTPRKFNAKIPRDLETIC